MKDFAGKIAVVTGGGTGMGRALVRQLIAQGCDVAYCDVSESNLAQMAEICEQEAPQGVRTSGFICDVSNEDDFQHFADHVQDVFNTQHINLLFNNAGIAGGGSFLNETREVWERTFNVCWKGVYFGSRVFMPMLVASDEGHIVNTSSINGFWASAGPNAAHTAYSAAKFAVKGFTEALVTDLRLNAPHVKASVVMPGHVGTDIILNGNAAASDNGKRTLGRMMGLDVDAMSEAEVQAAFEQLGTAFRDAAPTSADEAATIILDGVKAAQWRILVGEDAKRLDHNVRTFPERAYDPDFPTLSASETLSPDSA